jgi:hypothetical protein
MILQRLLAHLKTSGAATLEELARVVDAPPDAVSNMLETLERKGLVHRRQTTRGCGATCRQCNQIGFDVYCLGATPAGDGFPSGCGARPETTNAPGD